jgi:hypothetical protein
VAVKDVRIGVPNLLPRLGACGGPKGETFAVSRSHSGKRLGRQDVHVPTLRIGTVSLSCPLQTNLLLDLRARNTLGCTEKCRASGERRYLR